MDLQSEPASMTSERLSSSHMFFLLTDDKYAMRTPRNGIIGRGTFQEGLRFLFQELFTRYYCEEVKSRPEIRRSQSRDR